MGSEYIIPFNRPYLTGIEAEHIRRVLECRKFSGDGEFANLCHRFFAERWGFRKALTTTSCTDALEMAALLCDIEPGDEVIMPSFTFVSTANAFVLRGARIVFADSNNNEPNLDTLKLSELCTARTKAIVVVHYAGVACDMDPVLELAAKRNIFVIEDAAQAISSRYKGRVLGGIGNLSAFSFHETKNVHCGEGGMLVVNDARFVDRAEILREKGTNRSAFFRGEVNKYGWVDVGSSFLPADLVSAFLYAQLLHLDDIQRRRISIWERYWAGLFDLEESGLLTLPKIPDYATNNAHMFYVICDSLQTRTGLIKYLKGRRIMAPFHYLPLHASPFYSRRHDGRDLPNADRFSDCLVRLPLYVELSERDQLEVINSIRDYFDLRRMP